MVPKKPNVKELKELGGATICVAQGTTHEFNMAGWFRGRGMTIKPVVFESQDIMYEAFFGGRCDAMTQDSSALASALATRGKRPTTWSCPTSSPRSRWDRSCAVATTSG